MNIVIISGVSFSSPLSPINRPCCPSRSVHRDILSAQKDDLEKVQQLLDTKADLEILADELENMASKSQVTAIENKVRNWKCIVLNATDIAFCLSHQYLLRRRVVNCYCYSPMCPPHTHTPLRSRSIKTWSSVASLMCPSLPH